MVGRHGDGWKLRVTAAPERGRANDEVLAVLAIVLDVPRTAMRLVAGAASRDKVVEVDGLDAAEIDRRLDRTQTPAGQDPAQARGAR